MKDRSTRSMCVFQGGSSGSNANGGNRDCIKIEVKNYEVNRSDKAVTTSRVMIIRYRVKHKAGAGKSIPEQKLYLNISTRGASKEYLESVPAKVRM